MTAPLRARDQPPFTPTAVGRHAHRPRGWVRHLTGMISPIALTASRVALEHGQAQRRQRLAAAARDRFQQRVRPTRERMRALSISPGARFAWQNVPAPPPPGPDGAIVHPIAVATCDLDRPLALGATPFLLPLHFGHECIAQVLTVGERVLTISPGDRVVVPFQISCGRCVRCRAGLTSNCEAVPPISMYGFGVGGGHWGGVVSDQLAVPYADGCSSSCPTGSIPPPRPASPTTSVTPTVTSDRIYPCCWTATPTCTCSIHRRSTLSASVPLYAALIARALGAREIRFTDARPAVRAHAESLGITTIAPAELRGQTPARLVVDVSGTAGGLRTALTLTDQDGICTSSGGLHNNTRIPTGLMYGRNCTLHYARAHARSVIPQVLELIADGRLEPQLVTTHHAHLDDAPQALREHTLGEVTKTVLTES